MVTHYPTLMLIKSHLASSCMLPLTESALPSRASHFILGLLWTFSFSYSLSLLVSPTSLDTFPIPQGASQILLPSNSLLSTQPLDTGLPKSISRRTRFWKWSGVRDYESRISAHKINPAWEYDMPVVDSWNLLCSHHPPFTSSGETTGDQISGPGSLCLPWPTSLAWPSAPWADTAEIYLQAKYPWESYQAWVGA